MIKDNYRKFIWSNVSIFFWANIANLLFVYLSDSSSSKQFGVTFLIFSIFLLVAVIIFGYFSFRPKK